MNKRKLMLVAVALCMVAILGFGGTLAYLTDTDHAKNVFVTGKVGLNLDEAKVEKNADGDYVSVTPAERVKKQTYKVFPGNEILKDPTITLDKGSENAWIAAKIVISGKGVYDLFGVEGYDNIDICKQGADKEPIFSGELLSETTAQETYKGLWGYGNGKIFIHQVPNKANNTWTFYIYMKEPQAEGVSITLFNKVSIPEEWDNDEMEKFNNLTIDITAYAVQADGFHNCVYAMSSAYGTNGVTKAGVFPDTTDANK